MSLSDDRIFTQRDVDDNDEEWCVIVKAIKRQRDELADALRVYLNAGSKETRAAAAVIAKAALAKGFV